MISVSFQITILRLPPVISRSKHQVKNLARQTCNGDGCLCIGPRSVFLWKLEKFLKETGYLDQHATVYMVQHMINLSKGKMKTNKAMPKCMTYLKKYISIVKPILGMNLNCRRSESIHCEDPTSEKNMCSVSMCVPYHATP
jgi:hypothetical protein